jgi:long-chain acyl-CoA synthetase
MIRMEDAGALKRGCSTFMAWPSACGPDILDGKPVGFGHGDRLLYALGNLLVYGPLRNTWA